VDLSFYVSYLMMLSTTRLYSLSNRMINECKAIDGRKINMGNCSNQRRLSPIPLYLSQIPHELTEDET
jgi:hypothetical protein